VLLRELSIGNKTYPVFSSLCYWLTMDRTGLIAHIVAFCAMVCPTQSAVGQVDNIYVYGRVKILDPTLQQDSVLVVVADTLNRDTSFLIARAPKFKYECHLAYGSVYQLSFTMPKHFSEQLLIDATEVPPDEVIGGHGMNVDITLIPRIHGTDSSLFEPLRATARFDEAVREFLWIMDPPDRSERDKLQLQCQAIIDQKLSTERLDSLKDGLGVLYPSIRLWGRSKEDFVPRHWKIFASAAGDLNGDGHSDLVIAMESEDPIRHVRPGGSTSPTRPRTLLIALGSGQGHYKALIRNNDFLMRSDEDHGASPELDLGISNAGDLTLRYQLQQGRAWFTFALVRNGLECVAYEGGRIDPKGEVAFIAFNVHDKKLIIRKGSEQKGFGEETAEPFPSDLELSMDALGRPFKTVIRPGIYF